MAFTIDEDIIQKVKEATDIVDLISDYIDLRPTGENYQGLCPFHTEKTPSFSVNRENQFFHCFGCGKGGDVFNFLIEKEGFDFIEAVKYLADRNGIELKEKTEEDLKRDKEREKIYEVNRLAARYFYIDLLKNTRAKNYLVSRNIDKNIVYKFGLGYADSSWNSLLNHLKSKGYEEDVLEKAGLIGLRRDKSGYYDKFRDRIIFPIIDLKGNVLGFGGRVLGDDMPKYLNSQDTPVFNKGNTLYGLNLIKDRGRKEELILVEGYMDVIALYIKGIENALAGLGTAFTKNQGRLLKKHGKNIYLCYDSDKAGQKAGLKTLNILKSLDIDARVIVLPKGYDPDDYVSEFGLDSFNNLKNKAMSYIDYYMYVYKGKYNLKNYEERLEFINTINEIIKLQKSPVEKELYAEKLAKETSVSKESILAEVYKEEVFSKKQIADSNFNRDDYSKVKKKLNPAYKEAEDALLYLSIRDKKYFEYIDKNMGEEKFISSESEEDFNKIQDHYRRINKEDLLDEIDYILDTNVEKRFKHLSNLLSDISYSQIDHLLLVLKYNRLKIQRENLAREIEDSEKNKEFDKLKALCQDLIDINKEIKDIEEKGAINK